MKTYVEAETRQESEAKVNAAMTVAMTTEGNIAGVVTMLVIDGRDTPVQYEGFRCDDLEAVASAIAVIAVPEPQV